MLAFLPPLPAMRPDPEPEPPSPARAAEMVILIFVALNVMFVLTALLPLLARKPVEATRAANGVDHCAPGDPSVPPCQAGATARVVSVRGGVR